LGEGNEVGFGSATTGKAEACERKRCAHESDEIPPGEWILFPFGGSGREFAVQPLFEIRSLRVFAKAAPIGTPLRGRRMMESTFHGLAMAPAATHGGFYIPLFDEFFAKFALARAHGWFPIQIGNLVKRAEMIFRSTVALQAPTHAVGFGVVDDFHVVDVPVASNTTDAAIHVNRMIEVDVVGSFMNSDPRNRIAGLPRLAYGSKLRALGFDLSVAVHAGLGGWNIGVGGFFNSRMAVATVHSKLIHMEGVIERHGLGRLITDSCVFWGKIVGHPRDNAGRNDCETDQDFDRQPVAKAGKYIGHGGSVGIFQGVVSI
jgi:hypothetical protein